MAGVWSLKEIRNASTVLIDFVFLHKDAKHTDALAWTWLWLVVITSYFIKIKKAHSQQKSKRGMVSGVEQALSHKSRLLRAAA